MTSMDPTATLIVRSVMPSDYEICMQLDHTTSTETVWQMVIDDCDGGQRITFRPSSLPRSMKALYPRGPEALLQSWRTHACFLVASWDGEVVGYVNVREELAQETAWVADLIVDRAYRMRGVGTAMLRGARQWALERGLRRLMVETQTKNYPAIRFLQKRGLVFSGYNDLYYPNQDIAIFFGQVLR